MDNLKAFSTYIRTIAQELARADATEHTHRPALKALLESLGNGIVATNEPRRIDCGAPDFVLTRGQTTIGYVEAKDVGGSLDEAERSEQLQRYRNSLSNLILTDYLEFRWYVDGERRLAARLGTTTRDGGVRRDAAGIEASTWLFDNFLSHRAEPVGRPKELALRMARLAHLMRDLIIATFEKELEGGALHAQFLAFRENLIPDLSTEQFADMYAQTIAYGLFAARCNQFNGAGFTRQNAAYLLPKTNPFLRKLFNHIAGPDLDDRIAWLVDDLAQLLDEADMEAILKDFGKRTAKEDPVVHFYETFLEKYDDNLRKVRGVYYTPEPVVSYIVRSIDHLLKARFNKPQGLVDPSVLVLDPAVGTATFLYLVINEIHQALVSQGQAGLWNDYVAEKLLPRLFGFELLMAPYAVAHLKLGLLLKETGYQFKSDQRLGIYLTNTLEEAIKRSETLFATWITEEANAAAEIKKDKPIMVVLGNPPYSVSSANKGQHIESLMERYKVAVRNERNIQPLSDDYIKFIRFAHDRIERTGYGIVGMITNHTYLSGLIHRGMREELMKSFSEIYVLNLHGSALLGEKTPDGGKDENVFDIRQGVAVALFVREPGASSPARVRYADLWGLRDEKYRCLLENDINAIPWQKIEPTSPYFFFVPKKLDFRQEYDDGWSVATVFIVNSTGIKTHRDHFVVDFDEECLRARIAEFRSSSLPDHEISERFDLRNTRDWDLAKARVDLKNRDDWAQSLHSYLYHPFDVRSICYSAYLIELPRAEVMHHMLRENVALLTMRGVRTESYEHIFATNTLANKDAVSIKDSCNVFPLYLYPSPGELETGRHPNLNPEFTRILSTKLGLKFLNDGNGDLKETFGPEDIFNYAYAVFHSPTYRRRYAEFLKTDFPRLPLTSNRNLFRALVQKGAELVALHLMESPLLNSLVTKYPVSGPNVVEKVAYNEPERRVHINRSQYFEGVPPEVWSFHIGGYQVCQKWLKDRKGRTLSYDDLTHYQKIVVALKETIRLMTEIDALIPNWPLE